MLFSEALWVDLFVLNMNGHPTYTTLFGGSYSRAIWHGDREAVHAGRTCWKSNSEVSAGWDSIWGLTKCPTSMDMQK